MQRACYAHDCAASPCSSPTGARNRPQAWAAAVAAFSSRAVAAIGRRISQATPTRSATPTASRCRLVYFELPAVRGRWLTGTLAVRHPARCTSAGMNRPRPQSCARGHRCGAQVKLGAGAGIGGLDLERPAQVVAKTTDQFETEAAAYGTPQFAAARERRIQPADLLGRHAAAGMANADDTDCWRLHVDHAAVAVFDGVAQQVADCHLQHLDGCAHHRGRQGAERHLQVLAGDGMAPVGHAVFPARMLAAPSERRRKPPADGHCPHDSKQVRRRTALRQFARPRGDGSVVGTDGRTTVRDTALSQELPVTDDHDGLGRSVLLR